MNFVKLALVALLVGDGFAMKLKMSHQVKITDGLAAPVLANSFLAIDSLLATSL